MSPEYLEYWGYEPWSFRALHGKAISRPGRAPRDKTDFFQHSKKALTKFHVLLSITIEKYTASHDFSIEISKRINSKETPSRCRHGCSLGSLSSCNPSDAFPTTPCSVI